MKYKEGDKVILARPSLNPRIGRYNIPEQSFGKDYVVIARYDTTRIGAPLVIEGQGIKFAVYDDMLDLIGGPW